MDIPTFLCAAKQTLRLAELALKLLDEKDNLVLRQIGSTFYKTAKQHFEQANQSINDENRREEFFGGISNLMNAYHLLIDHSDKSRWFGLVRIPMLENYEQLINFATLITLAYAEYGERYNALEWKQKALHLFQKYERIYPSSVKPQCYVTESKPVMFYTPGHMFRSYENFQVFSEEMFKEKLQSLKDCKDTFEEILADIR